MAAGLFDLASGASFPVPDPGPVVVGSAGDGDLQLLGRGVARRHLELARTSAGWLARRLGGQVFLHPRADPVILRILDRSPVQHGDVLQLGERSVLFVEEGAESTSAPPPLVLSWILPRLRAGEPPGPVDPAIRSLLQAGEESLLDRLVDRLASLLLDSREPRHRQAMVRLLALIGPAHPRTIRPLRSALSDPDEGVREAAARGVAADPGEPPERLIAGLALDSERVLNAALEGLLPRIDRTGAARVRKLARAAPPLTRQRQRLALAADRLEPGAELNEARKASARSAGKKGVRRGTR